MIASHSKAQIIREMIRHENTLINHRITWFSTLQGLLFTALAFSWDKKDAAGLSYVFAVLGILLSISTFYSMRASLAAIKALREWWDNNRGQNYDGPDVIGRRPDAKSLPLLRPYVVFPLSFTIAWSWILAYKIL